MVGLFASNERVSLLAFGGIILTLGGLAVTELYTMAEKCGYSPFKNLGLVASIVLLGVVFWSLGIEENAVLAHNLEMAIFFCLIPVLGIFQLRVFNQGAKSSIVPMAITLFGVVYVALLLNLLQKIRFLPEVLPGYSSLEGHWWLLFFILVTKMSDTGAYCTGQLIGKTKMIPRVSPGKTWEGFFGGIAFSVITAWLFQYYFGLHFGKMPLNHALILGVLLGVGSVIGDLVESLMKREAGVKDSGSFFPGVGGILDLLDSLLFNAPLMYLYLMYVLPK